MSLYMLGEFTPAHVKVDRRRKKEQEAMSHSWLLAASSWELKGTVSLIGDCSHPALSQGCAQAALCGGSASTASESLGLLDILGF